MKRAAIAALAACTFGCTGPPPAPGSLTISYVLGEAGAMQPSYQTAIWLEDSSGRYLKTLFVSEYLSYCGTGYTTICPEWINSANWDEVSEAELDAVTGATPPIASNALRVECPKSNIPVGSYRYCVQTHLEEKYNILFRGEISVGQMESQSTGVATYEPGMPPQGRAVLSDVKARYCP